MSDGATLCLDCAKKEFRQIVEATKAGDNSGWRVAGIDVFWEGPPGFCCHCNKVMESEYGDPWAEEREEREEM